MVSDLIKLSILKLVCKTKYQVAEVATFLAAIPQ